MPTAFLSFVPPHPAALMEEAMERDDSVIELGTASAETRGQTGPIVDFRLGIPMTGLADD